jgi:ABC-type uncharacterized transport system substrate-binding protein
MGRTASRFLCAFFAAAATLTMTAGAGAHPHVLPTVRTNLIFSSDGRMTAVQHTWTYDAAYSTFAARDIDANKDGIIAKDELAVFAKSQLDALAGHNYFTTVTTPAGSFEFGPPESYGVEKLDDGRLQLKFTVPLKAAPAVDKQLIVEIYDPNFFAYFTMADDGVHLVGARNGCVPIAAGPQPIDLKNTRSIPALFWQALDGSKTAGLQFVNTITVKCPQ